MSSERSRLSTASFANCADALELLALRRALRQLGRLLAQDLLGALEAEDVELLRGTGRSSRP